jgi:hypothetical protein
MSFPTSLRHQQKAELYNAARYLDACDEKLVSRDAVDPAYYRACAQVCRLRLEEAPNFDYYSDLLEHSDAFRTIAKNLEYEQMLMCFRAELYPELDALMVRYEGRHG